MSHNDRSDYKMRDGGLLTVEQRTDDGLRTLAVAGDLDMTTYERFCQVLLDEADRETRDALRLDLTGVDYIDAHTWLLIVRVRRQLTALGRAFSVALESGRQPERVYRLLALDRVIPRF